MISFAESGKFWTNHTAVKMKPEAIAYSRKSSLLIRRKFDTDFDYVNSPLGTQRRSSSCKRNCFHFHATGCLQQNVSHLELRYQTDKKRGIGLYQKPLNVTKRKPQNRNIFHSKPTTAIKAREDVYAVEVVEAHIFRRETGKNRTPSNRKSEKPILFLPKTWKPRAKQNRTANRNRHNTEKPFFFNAKAEKPI